jgi:D-alanyl-D-alanine carboxypeptidase (penicillin-binding protein 5/6)
MRPPAHWHVTRRRINNEFTWWVIVGAVAVVVAVALVGRMIVAASGDGGSSGSPMVGVSVPTDLDDGSGCPEHICATPTESVDHAAGVDAAAPDVTARGAVVMEASCGELLFAKNQDAQFAPASTTKIVTALVADDLSDPEETVAIDVNSALLVASTGSTVMGLQPGQEMSIRDLLYGMLLASGNDAAIAIAEHVAGSVPDFVELMNDKVAELGLEHSRFGNPHGLDQPEHYSSAYDMATFGRALLENERLATIVRTQEYQPVWDGPQVWNGNELIGFYPGAVGVKIGYTENAGQTIVAAATRGDRTIIVSLLSSWQRYTDTMALFDWAFDQTESVC